MSLYLIFVSILGPMKCIRAVIFWRCQLLWHCQYFKNMFIEDLLKAVVQWLSYLRLFATPWTAACQAFLFFTISWSLFKLMSIESVMPSNHLILCRPLLLLSIFPTIRVFSNEWALHIRWPKYWSFSISCSSEYSGPISFRIDWFDLLAVQGTLKNLLLFQKKESSSTPQFKTIDSSALSFLYGPILTSIHDYWKNHSLD